MSDYTFGAVKMQADGREKERHVIVKATLIASQRSFNLPEIAGHTADYACFSMSYPIME